MRCIPFWFFAFCLLFFSYRSGSGNGFLAVYIGGLVIGNSRFPHKGMVRNFFDGLSWLSQIIMFLALGLLVNPSELWPVAGWVYSLVYLWLCLPGRQLSFFRFGRSVNSICNPGCLPVGWVYVGLSPLFCNVSSDLWCSRSQDSFQHRVFYYHSVAIGAGHIHPWIARKLHVAHPHKSIGKSAFELAFSEDIKSAMSEVVVTEESLRYGNKIMDIPLPDKTLVVMVKRSDSFFIPRGQTEIRENDRLLIISDDEKALQQTYEDLGMDSYI